MLHNKYKEFASDIHIILYIYKQNTVYVMITLFCMFISVWLSYDLGKNCQKELLLLIEQLVGVENKMINYNYHKKNHHLDLK